MVKENNNYCTNRRYGDTIDGGKFEINKFSTLSIYLMRFMDKISSSNNFLISYFTRLTRNKGRIPASNFFLIEFSPLCYVKNRVEFWFRRVSQIFSKIKNYYVRG